jgi:hypothetical protein
MKIKIRTKIKSKSKSKMKIAYLDPTLALALNLSPNLNPPLTLSLFALVDSRKRNWTPALGVFGFNQARRTDDHLLIAESQLGWVSVCSCRLAK